MVINLFKEDFINSLKKVKPSVGVNDLKNYEKFTDEFG
jgi:SpoVK/Ycf46/Vps4 family AAA+-type ATPase